MDIAIDGDKLGRTVTVERSYDENAEEYGITLGVGGRPGEEEWTWLTDHEAHIIATALLNECGGDQGYSLRDERGRAALGMASKAEERDLVAREMKVDEDPDE